MRSLYKTSFVEAHGACDSTRLSSCTMTCLTRRVRSNQLQCGGFVDDDGSQNGL